MLEASKFMSMLNCVHQDHYRHILLLVCLLLMVAMLLNLQAVMVTGAGLG